MTSAERSARNDAIRVQKYATVREVMQECADIHLEAGRTLSEAGMKDIAHKSLRQAEIAFNTIKILDTMLVGYDHVIKTKAELMLDNSNLPNPWYTTLAEKAEKPKISKQEEYEALRAKRRPLIDTLYGHLAKAEKEEPVEPAALEALEPHAAAVDMVHDIKPVRDNGSEA